MNQYTYPQRSHASALKSELDDFGISVEDQIDALVHELRQPLSVIDSLAYHLELTSDDDNARRRLRQIQAMVVKANQILSERGER